MLARGISTTTLAACACQVALQDELDEALAGGDQGRVDSLLQHSSEDPQQLFERSIAMAAGWGCQQGATGEGAGTGTVVQAPAGGEQAPAPVPASGVAAEGPGACGQEAVGSAAGVPAGDGLQTSNGVDANGSACMAEEPAVPAAPAAQADGSSMQGPPGSGGQEQEAPAALPAVMQQQEPQQQAPQQQEPQQHEPQQPLGSTGPGWQWYPYSYLGGYLVRRAEFLGKCAAAFPAAADGYAAAALSSLRGGLGALAEGAAVLAKYKYMPTGEKGKTGNTGNTDGKQVQAGWKFSQTSWGRLVEKDQGQGTDQRDCSCSWQHCLELCP
jgi:hypothetical protein